MTKFLQDLSDTIFERRKVKVAPRTRLSVIRAEMEPDVIAPGSTKIELSALFTTRAIISDTDSYADVFDLAKKNLIEQFAHEVYGSIRDDLRDLVSKLLEEFGDSIEYRDLNRIADAIKKIEYSTHPS